jgi:cytochrome P450
MQAGPRICLGKDMAYLQMKVVAASLLRLFKFTVVPGHVVTYRSTIVFTMKHGLQMTVERRK